MLYVTLQYASRLPADQLQGIPCTVLMTTYLHTSAELDGCSAVKGWMIESNHSNCTDKFRIIKLTLAVCTGPDSLKPQQYQSADSLVTQAVPIMLERSNCIINYIISIYHFVLKNYAAHGHLHQPHNHHVQC